MTFNLLYVILNIGRKLSKILIGTGGIMILDLSKLRVFDIEVITLGLKCTKCGRTWGLNLSALKDLDEIPANRILCDTCSNHKVKLTK